MIIIVACDLANGIGFKGQLPWQKLSKDLSHFKNLTMGNTVLMGRKTWDSIPLKFKPLTNRLNIVLTRDKNKKFPKDVIVIHKFSEIPEQIQGKLFVIGGMSIYKWALQRCDEIYLTRIYDEYTCDTFFPDIHPNFKLEHRIETINENNTSYDFLYYTRQSEEYQYLNLLKKIIFTGTKKNDRTGVGTLSLFGTRMKFSLRNNTIPLITTKRTFWRGIVEELLWFINGSTNSNLLSDKNIKIWDKNGSLEFLKSRGITNRQHGDLGPVYGFQWRHFGAEYIDMHTDYTNQGIDQLANIIKIIKTNPTDRRIILSAWNPKAQSKMALPPCHILAQFNISNGELNCQFYQRSADMGLGVPFNIASYALLTHLIAHCTGLKAGELIHIMGDTHVYTNHISGLLVQLERIPKNFPTLHINTENTNIDKFSYTDFKLQNYNPHPKINLEMAL